MAIYNQCTSISAVGVVPKKVQKKFSCCFPLQKLIIFIFYVENVPDPTQIQNCFVKNLKCYKKHTPGQKKIPNFGILLSSLFTRDSPFFEFFFLPQKKLKSVVHPPISTSTNHLNSFCSSCLNWH